MKLTDFESCLLETTLGAGIYFNLTYLSVIGHTQDGGLVVRTIGFCYNGTWKIMALAMLDWFDIEKYGLNTKDFEFISVIEALLLCPELSSLDFPGVPDAVSES